MIYVKGTTFWHGVRAHLGDRIATLCGRRMSGDSIISETAPAALFVCRTCEITMARSA